MNNACKAIIAAVLMVAPHTSLAQDLSEARIKELVYEAILENPDIIMEAVGLIQQRDEEAQANATQAVLTDQRSLLERDPNAPVLGNPDGDVTIVEFFDYNCPYCKRAMPEVQAVLDEDPNVRLVYREWPILGEGSIFASRAALASRVQGKYDEFHLAMMGARGGSKKPRFCGLQKKSGWISSN